ncbi:MAG: flotillin family protein [Dehalococcoidia bacterium]|nr:MAG: flotillin family protein [Dehalococcoidia bacterium]
MGLDIGQQIAAWLTTLAIVGLVVLMLAIIIRMLRANYIKVPPHLVAVVSGRQHRIVTRNENGEEQTVTVGYRLVRGGATLVIPFLERKDELDLRVITIPNLAVQEAITREGVPLSIKAVANIKVGSEDTLLINAVERLIGKSQEEIRQMAYEALEGHLRSMLGTLSIEEINSDRAAFQQRMINESQSDLARLGLKIDILTVKELSDSQGYLAALGLKRTAEVKRDAEIGAADAQKEATIQATTAEKEGAVKEQENIALIKEAEKEKDVRVARYRAETNAESARAEQAGPLATAEARKAVVEKEQEVELVRTLKATEVAEAAAARREQELVAEVIRPAEAQRRSAEVAAEGRARAIEIEAEAQRKALAAEGEGRAAAKRAELLAEADGIRAKLLAEAEGTLKKAEAYKALNEAGRLLQILEAAQTLVPAAIKEFSGVMAAATAPLAEADKIIVMDSGSSNGHGSALDRYVGIGPQALFALVERCKAMGIDISPLLAKAGVSDLNAVEDKGV